MHPKWGWSSLSLFAPAPALCHSSFHFPQPTAADEFHCLYLNNDENFMLQIWKTNSMLVKGENVLPLTLVDPREYQAIVSFVPPQLGDPVDRNAIFLIEIRRGLALDTLSCHKPFVMYSHLDQLWWLLIITCWRPIKPSPKGGRVKSFDTLMPLDWNSDYGWIAPLSCFETCFWH